MTEASKHFKDNGLSDNLTCMIDVSRDACFYSDVKFAHLLDAELQAVRESLMEARAQVLRAPRG